MMEREKYLHENTPKLIFLKTFNKKNFKFIFFFNWIHKGGCHIKERENFIFSF